MRSNLNVETCRESSQMNTIDKVDNSITLTFHGVEFCLVPKQNFNDENSSSKHDNTSCGITMTPNTSGKFTAINMNSFTGTLYVSTATNDPAPKQTRIFVGSAAPSTPPPTSSATVEEESPLSESKELKKERLITTPVKGQQQLSFDRKKRNRPEGKSRSNRHTKNKKSNHTPKKCRRETDSSPAEVGTKGGQKINNVSPLLGQSTMLSERSDNSDSESIFDFMPPADSEPTLSSTADENVELVRKHSIQELVDLDGDFTQTQNVGDADEMSLTQTNTNTIIEFEHIDDLSTKIKNTTKSEAKEEVKVKQIMPSPRWGNTMTMIDESKVLVYGGQGYDTKTNSLVTLSDLYVYDLTKKTWKKPVNCEGMPRTWHTSTFLPDRSLLISFGGEKWNPKTNKSQTTDQVMVLDTEIMLWYPPSVSGQVPSGRSGHTASLLPTSNDLVVFGGVKNNKWQNSVAVLDTARWKWTAPKVAGDVPRARSYHSATPVPSPDKDGSLLVIFGGNNDVESFNTVHVLDTTDEDGKWCWFHPNVSGTPPSSRTGHCATLLEDNKTILIYGGWDPCDEDEDFSDDKMICGDSFLLDTETWTWMPGPNPKFIGHSGVENGGRKRTGASAVLAPGDDLSQMLVFGGRIPNDKFVNDFQSLTVPQQMIDVKLR